MTVIGAAHLMNGKPRQVRPPLQVDLRTVEHRQYRDAPHPDHAKILFRHALEGARSALAQLFAMTQSTYCRGLAQQAVFHEDAARRAAISGGCPDYSDDPSGEAMKPLMEALEAARISELFAETIVRTLDDIMASLVEALRGPVAKKGESVNTEVGPLVDGDVRVDRLLDAFGNMPRHRAEWKRSLKKGRRSLEALARAYTGDKNIAGARASYTIVEAEAFPALRILDLLSDYAEHGDAASYEHVEETLAQTGAAIIDRYWPEWWEHQRGGSPTAR